MEAEAPTAGRIVRSGSSRGEELLFDRVSSRLPTEVVAKLVTLVAPVDSEDGELEGVARCWRRSVGPGKRQLEYDADRDREAESGP